MELAWPVKILIESFSLTWPWVAVNRPKEGSAPPDYTVIILLKKLGGGGRNIKLPGLPFTGHSESATKIKNNKLFFLKI